MNIADLEDYLLSEQADFELIWHDKPILSLADAAGLFDLAKAAKTIILEGDTGLFAVILSSAYGKLNLEELRQRLSFSRLKLASSKKIEQKTGFLPPNIPLVGHKLPTMIDKKLLESDYLFGGSGHPLCTLKIDPQDLLYLNEISLQI
ncbi:YbaK/prolyl-tRNA synthetase associated domain-containing protein [Listeria floridensis FSL S10-1187]|uniref:YbaK/prolyl-tRNA synthetase associated domain-containing protein n=1 Tax=Listeria floridensis FSL S10-1187 TaxID=1265817 RepID=A0ABN0REI1_9LIST|nr:YbaK/EbsC family protein [Listeria floridensis]EUJ30983.1 YbaK/prolyl-tRNA synthetase associated domain-containing protein [Listeria floridensis FSL S10-1187]